MAKKIIDKGKEKKPEAAEAELSDTELGEAQGGISLNFEEIKVRSFRPNPAGDGTTEH